MPRRLAEAGCSRGGPPYGPCEPPVRVRAGSMVRAAIDGSAKGLGTTTTALEWTPSMKRSFDIVISVIGLVAFGWLIIALIVAIRLSSGGTGLFVQPRVGRGAKTFSCYKLRTMYSGTRIAATHEISAAAVTPLGHWLRRLKLDELPQLWNVLKGDMSVVGPRPCLPTQYELIDQRMTRGVFAVRPGITGPAQVLGIDMSEPVRLAEVDATYISTRSFLNDLALLVQTVVGAGRGDRVRTPEPPMREPRTDRTRSPT